MPTLDDALRSIDDRFESLVAEKRIPGLAWGVIRDGVLDHAGGTGTARDGEDRTPGADTVFRIASMTKSFTAATVLLMRDEGRLRLDDPVAAHVPDLEGWRAPVDDAPPVTLRQLLTMSAGLPTDDPWGDRQQELPLDAFAQLLRAGPTFAWAPGTAYDYSNLGYGILGRVITNVAGAEYRDVVRERVLAPLGMAATGYLEEEVPDECLAHGYVRRGDELVHEGAAAYGALASMGGILTSARDLATWIGGFLDAFPARSGPDDTHPLRRATRREMQQVQRFAGLEIRARAPDAEPSADAVGYGFGLFVTADPALGTVIGHGGGYPGFGSMMAWHPSTGLGLVALGNLRYAPVHATTLELLGVLVKAADEPRRAIRPMAVVDRCRDIVEGLIGRWDDAVADAAFAMNVDLDEPRDVRRAAVEKVAAELGPFRRDPDRPAVSPSPAELRWWLRGQRGWAEVTVLVSPEPAPRIQGLQVTPVGDPSSALVGAAERLLEAAAMPAPRWPGGVERADALDAGAVERTLRAAAARFGELRLGLPVAGDGRSATTWELITERGGRATLRVALHPETGALAELALEAAARQSPPEAW